MDLIEQFQIGYMAVASAIFWSISYLVYRQFRRFTAWMNRDDAPKERVGAYVTMWAVFGFLIGGLSQSAVDTGVACHDAGEPVLACVFENA